MGEIAMRIGSREVYWELDDTAVAMLAQALIQDMGPATGER